MPWKVLKNKFFLSVSNHSSICFGPYWMSHHSLLLALKFMPKQNSGAGWWACWEANDCASPGCMNAVRPPQLLQFLLAWAPEYWYYQGWEHFSRRHGAAWHSRWNIVWSARGFLEHAGPFGQNWRLQCSLESSKCLTEAKPIPGNAGALARGGITMQKRK